MMISVTMCHMHSLQFTRTIRVHQGEKSLSVETKIQQRITTKISTKLVEGPYHNKLLLIKIGLVTDAVVERKAQQYSGICGPS